MPTIAISGITVNAIPRQPSKTTTPATMKEIASARTNRTLIHSLQVIGPMPSGDPESPPFADLTTPCSRQPDDCLPTVRSVHVLSGLAAMLILATTITP
jgi:hypothetical protein